MKYGFGHKHDEMTAWCRRLFTSLNDRGTWTIPRSGLIFQKQEEKLVLITNPGTEAAESDYQASVENFGRAGIEVTRAPGM